MSKNQILLLYIIGAAITEIAGEMIAPVLPVICHYFNKSEPLIESAISLSLGGFAVAGMLAGPCSDKFGRKNIIMFGMTLFAISNIVCFLIDNVYVLIISRLTQGIGGGCAMVACLAGMSDLYKGDALAKNLSKMSMIVSVAPAVGPVIGSVVSEIYRWQFIFTLLSIMSIIYIFFALKLPSDTKKDQQNTSLSIKSIYKVYASLLENKQFLKYLLIHAAVVSVIWIEIVKMPFIFTQQMKLRQMYYGYLVSINVLAYTAGTKLNQTLIDRLGPRKLLQYGTIGFIVSNLVVITFNHHFNLTPLHITILKIPGAVFMAFCISNSTAVALNAITKNKGAGSAFIESSQTIIGAIAAYITSHFTNMGIFEVCVISVLVFAPIAYFNMQKEEAIPHIPKKIQNI